jgi:thiol-disulfide isomerase/thioredoxin
MIRVFNTLLVFIIIFFISACEQSQQSVTTPADKAADKTPEPVLEITGTWRGVLASPGGELPFGIDIMKAHGVYTAKIINGPERVDTSSVEFNGDQVTINFEWYDARIKAKLSANGQTMNGQWSKTAPEQISKLDFSATKGAQHRFNQELKPTQGTTIAGNWQVVFTDEDGQDKAIAELSQDGQIVNGTFLTPTGDYRYLAGSANNNKLLLSAFDGAHAFLFSAQLDNNTLKGDFWSRDSYHATWLAHKSADTSGYLPSSWEMNKVTTADNTISFAFENLAGEVVQLSDARFVDKPVLVNLFGTWCPNCNDEAPVLAEFYNKYNPQGLEIIGLAFEFTEDPVRDKKQIKRFKQRHKINYPLLLAGVNDKEKATKILGFLDKVKSYPTTLFLDKNHQVVNIHTGFSGPGTGEHYTQLVKELEQEIVALLN